MVKQSQERTSPTALSQMSASKRLNSTARTLRTAPLSAAISAAPSSPTEAFKFLSCDFPKATIQRCDFSSAKFSDCYVPFAEMEHSLPSQPNLREALARNLTIETDKLGLPGERRLYRMAELKAREQHLLAAVMARSAWYKAHFDPLARLGAASRLVGSYVNKLLWGYGERISV